MGIEGKGKGPERRSCLRGFLPLAISHLRLGCSFFWFLGTGLFEEMSTFHEHEKRAPPKEGLDPHAQVAIGVIVPIAALLGSLILFIWYVNRRRRIERGVEFEDAASSAGGRYGSHRPKLNSFLRGGREREEIPDDESGRKESVMELEGRANEKIELEGGLAGGKVVELRDTDVGKRAEMEGDQGRVVVELKADRSEESLPSKPKRRALLPPVDWTIPMTVNTQTPPRSDSLPQSPTSMHMPPTLRSDSAVEETMAKLENRIPSPSNDLRGVSGENEDVLPPVLKRHTNPFRKSLQVPGFRSSLKHHQQQSERATSSRYSPENNFRFSDVSALQSEPDAGSNKASNELGRQTPLFRNDLEFRISADSYDTQNLELSPEQEASAFAPRRQASGGSGSIKALDLAALPPQPPPPTSPPPAVPERSVQRPASGAEVEWMRPKRGSGALKEGEGKEGEREGEGVDPLDDEAKWEDCEDGENGKIDETA